MSVLNSVKQQTMRITRKALRLGEGFTHPVSDDQPGDPDYVEVQNIEEHDMPVNLPNTAEWGPGYPTTTFIDQRTGCLTAATAGNPPLDDGWSIYDVYADRAERMGDKPL